HTRSKRDWSSDVCSSDLKGFVVAPQRLDENRLRSRIAEVRQSLEGRFPGLLVGVVLKHPLELGESVMCPEDAYSDGGVLPDGLRSEERRVGKECGAGRGG